MKNVFKYSKTLYSRPKKETIKVWDRTGVTLGKQLCKNNLDSESVGGSLSSIWNLLLPVQIMQQTVQLWRTERRATWYWEHDLSKHTGPQNTILVLFQNFIYSIISAKVRCTKRPINIYNTFRGGCPN